MMKRVFLIFFLALTTLSYANDDVYITVLGSGKNKEEAVQTALREALFQTYNSFVSENNKLLNEKVKSDKIISLSSGNIGNHQIISEKTLSNGTCHVLLQVMIDVQHLTKFVHGEGSSVKVDMNAFNAKVQMEELKQSVEKKAIDDLIAIIETTELWDYTLRLDEPSVAEDKYVISGTVDVKYNTDMCKIIELMTDVLQAFDISDQLFGMVKGMSVHEYTRGQRLPDYEGPTLRNEYKNGLLFCDYYPTPDFKQDKYNKGLEPEINLYLTKEGETTKSTVLNKIRFRIDPLKIIVNGDKTYIWHQSFIDLETNKLYLNYEEAKGTLSERIKHTPHAPGDVIFQIHFEKKVSREEALKIKQVNVQPL